MDHAGPQVHLAFIEVETVEQIRPQAAVAEREIDITSIEFREPDEKLRLGVVLAIGEATELRVKCEGIEDRDLRRHDSCVPRDLELPPDAAECAPTKESAASLL